MEKIADKMEAALKDQISLYEQLRELLEEEKTLIVDMNIDSLWKTNTRKKQLTLQLAASHGIIMEILKERNLDPDPGHHGTGLAGCIRKLPVPAPVKGKLEKLRTLLSAGKESVAGLAKANGAYINEYLAMINGIISTVAVPANREQYGGGGRMLQNQHQKRLISAEV